MPIVALVVTLENEIAAPAATALPPEAPVLTVVVIVSVAVAESVTSWASVSVAEFSIAAVVWLSTTWRVTDAPTPVESPVVALASALASLVVVVVAVNERSAPLASVLPDFRTAVVGVKHEVDGERARRRRGRCCWHRRRRRSTGP